MDEPTRSEIPNRLLGFSIHLLLLLVGLASGVALIYSLQPPKPPPSSLLCEMHIFTSHKPIHDFSNRITAFREAAEKGVDWDDPGSVGKSQFSTPGIPILVHATLQTQVLPRDSFTALQFEFYGSPIGDRIHSYFKIKTADSEVTHQLDLGEGEYRIIEILPGDKSGRLWCYAIIFVEAVKPTSSMAAPVPAPPARAAP